MTVAPPGKTLTMRDDDEDETRDDETPEEFREAIEDDPSTAPADDDGLEQIRGG